MINTKMIENAKELAKEIVRIENEIQLIIESNQYNYDVFYHQEKGWITQTSYCQIGGCIAGFIAHESEESARKISARMTFMGLKPNVNGICSTCREDLYEMQTC